jgi:hypothetical protein
MKLEFSPQYFEKNTQISNFMKIRLVGAELFHSDRRTDMTKLTVPFRNFANAPKYSGRTAYKTHQHTLWAEPGIFKC